jgi:hypothetical protein
MTCPYCGAENPPGSVFCFHCGARKDRKQVSWGAWMGVLVLVVIGIAAALLWPGLLSRTVPRISQDLAELAPPDCGVFLLMRSSGDTSLAGIWSRFYPSTLMRETVSMFLPGQGPMEETMTGGLFSLLEPSLQCAVRWPENHVAELYAIAEIHNIEEFPAQMDALNQRLRQIGVDISTVSMGDETAWLWQNDRSLYLVQRQNLLFLASSKEGLHELLNPTASPHLQQSQAYRRAREAYSGSPLFLFVDFIRLPDFPPQLGSLVLASPALENQIALRGECRADLAALLGSADILSALLKTSSASHDPFSSTPSDASFAFSGPGALDQIVRYWSQQGALELPPLDLSWLEGSTEAILLPGQEMLPNLCFAVTLTPSQVETGKRELARIESLAASVEDMTFTREEMEGMRVTVFELGGSQLLYAFSESTFYLAFDPDTMSHLLRVRTTGLPLARVPALAPALAALQDYPWKIFMNEAKLAPPQGSTWPEGTSSTSQQKGQLLLGLRLQTDRVLLEGRLLLSGETSPSP